MNDKLIMVPVSEVTEKLGGVIIKIKSHNARENTVRLLGGIKGLISIKWVLYSRHSAAEGYFLISKMDAELLKQQTSRWARSISYPKKVPQDLDLRGGGIF